MQGRDLFDADTPTPEDWLIEEDGMVPMFGARVRERVRTLVTERWRLSYHHGPEWWELYDLAQDPEESENLWGSAAARGQAAALVERLVARMTAFQDTSPLPTGRA